MTDEHEETQSVARVRRHRWFAWVWVVPAVAAAIVVWLAWRTLADRGPLITISFRAAEGLQAGQTHIQHRNADVGVVESLELTPDMSRVLVRARMTRQAAPYLNEGTRFYIVAPRVGVEGISGLSTIVSGTYIEMFPGTHGAPQKDFVALDSPPVLPPDTPGRSFTLWAPDLGSLTRGSPISYHGVSVGEVEDYVLDPDGKRVKVTAFVHAPHDKLVHPETRFWNAGGVDVSVGAQGVRVRANSAQQLLSGGIAFETPREALAGRSSAAGDSFDLYDNRRQALRAPHGEQLVYVADFAGKQRGVEEGISVELQGYEVGEVREVRLKYDSRGQTLITRVTFTVDPDQVTIADMPGETGPKSRASVGNWIETLVGHGLRAQVAEVSFITGQKVIALDMVPEAPAARVERVAGQPRIPSVVSGDLAEVMQSVRSVLNNLERMTSGPELGHALQALDQTMTRLDHITRDVEPDVKSLVKSLRDTSDAAQGTLNAVRGMMGGDNPTGADLPKLIHELTGAARSIRVLTDYLDRHPESLLRGRKGGQQ